jgi:hypothetical protein
MQIVSNSDNYNGYPSKDLKSQMGYLKEPPSGVQDAETDSVDCSEQRNSENYGFVSDSLRKGRKVVLRRK